MKAAAVGNYSRETFLKQFSGDRQKKETQQMHRRRLAVYTILTVNVLVIISSLQIALALK
jgi:hypothetical protein